MKKAGICLIVLLVLICQGRAIAQSKIVLDNWVRHQKDSLRKCGIDTIIFYHQYCGKCLAIEYEERYCEVSDNSWTFLKGAFIYKQKSEIFTLKFNYCKPPIKNKLLVSRSFPYLVSLMPTLNQRDRTYAQRRKQNKFFPPIPTDGLYDDVTIYFKKSSNNFSLNSYQKTDGYKYWKPFYWIDREIMAIKLIESDFN